MTATASAYFVCLKCALYCYRADPAAPCPCGGTHVNGGGETCGCGPTPTLGIVPADDPRWLGGHVDVRGFRHDPLRHRPDCPTQLAPEWE